MEKRTMADIRREKFNRQGQIARELADLALQEIDDALKGYAETADVINLFPERPDPPEPDLPAA